MMEGLGLLLREELGFLFVSNCEEMVSSMVHEVVIFLGKVVNDFLHLIDHRYLC